MHAGMILGAVVVIPRWHRLNEETRRFAEVLRGVFCLGSMLIGMETGMWVIAHVYGGNQSFATTLIGMLTGMTFGLLSSSALKGFGPAI